jgi:hypothetical protein
MVKEYGRKTQVEERRIECGKAIQTDDGKYGRRKRGNEREEGNAKKELKFRHIHPCIFNISIVEEKAT